MRYASGPDPSALRTMRPTEVLDEALRTYRVLASSLLRRSAVPAVFVLAGILFWTRIIGPRLFTTSNPGDVAAQVGEAGFVLTVGLLVATPLLVFGVVEATLQAVALATAHREGRREGEAATAAQARRAFPRALGAGMLAFLAAGFVPLASFGLLAVASLATAATSDSNGLPGAIAALGGIGLFAGLFVAAWAVGAYALAPAAALRGEGARDASRTSRRLMKGDTVIPNGYGAVWTVFLVLAVAALAESSGIRLVRDSLSQLRLPPGGGLFVEALGLLAPYLVAWTLLPLWGTAVAVIDGERRVRKEGYDVELLARG